MFKEKHLFSTDLEVDMFPVSDLTVFVWVFTNLWKFFYQQNKECKSVFLKTLFSEEKMRKTKSFQPMNFFGKFGGGCFVFIDIIQFFRSDSVNPSIQSFHCFCNVDVIKSRDDYPLFQSGKKRSLRIDLKGFAMCLVIIHLISIWMFWSNGTFKKSNWFFGVCFLFLRKNMVILSRCWRFLDCLISVKTKNSWRIFIFRGDSNCVVPYT